MDKLPDADVKTTVKCFKCGKMNRIADCWRWRDSILCDCGADLTYDFRDALGKPVEYLLENVPRRKPIALHISSTPKGA